MVTSRFEPIPTSGRQTYDVVLWASGSSPPCVFVGLSGSDERPEEVVRINGTPTTFNSVLALEGQYVVRRGVWLVADEIRADRDSRSRWPLSSQVLRSGSGRSGSSRRGHRPTSILAAASAGVRDRAHTSYIEHWC